MTKQEIADLISINLISGSKIPAEKHREVEYALLEAIFSVGFITGDIKEVDCSNEYIINNFETTGLGKNERLGWAICNGQNGTTNRNGRVSMPYGDTYLTMRAVGGSADATLPLHSHTYTQLRRDQEVSTSGSGVTAINKDPNSNLTLETSSSGESAINKNLQPYIVTLFIQKI
jgi:hypothetical protein